MRIYRNYPLARHNAFHTRLNAKYFVTIKSEDDLEKLLKDPFIKDLKVHILGNGSNTLFTKDFEGLVIKIAICGIKVIQENEKEGVIVANAGEEWSKLVRYTVSKNWSGLENLILIPGTVGAAPVQNIAAYGQNLEDVFVSLKALENQGGKQKVFRKTDCKFGYRDSVFKKELKNKYIITSVTFRLSKVNSFDTSYHSRYESLEGELSKFSLPPYSPADIARAVSRIRRRKFPNWLKLGTAGSFFLNPVVTIKKLAQLQRICPGVQHYPVDKLTYPQRHNPEFDHSQHVKIAAGWLFEELGWKGKRIGKVGTSPNQSLVIINYDHASASEILKFADLMKQDFKKHFGIELEYEVNII